MMRKSVQRDPRSPTPLGSSGGGQGLPERVKVIGAQGRVALGLRLADRGGQGPDTGVLCPRHNWGPGYNSIQNLMYNI
jgi:hypothetical protein